MPLLFPSSCRFQANQCLFVLTSLLLACYTNLAFADNGSLVRTSGFSIGSDPQAADDQTTIAPSLANNNTPTGFSSLNIPLKSSDRQQNTATRTSSINGLTGSLGTTVGALAVTLGLFAMFVAFARRLQRKQQGKNLPREAFEVIGETEIGPKQKLLVIRCGLQALIVGVSPAGIQPVAQIDDPDEAGHFMAQCRGLGSAAVFSSTLKEMEKEATRPGFVDDSSGPRSKGKLFLRA